MKEFKVSECIGHRVRRMSRMLDNRYRKLVKDFGISENQLNILFYLNEVKEVEQGVIGKFMLLDRSTVSRNIVLLEKKSLLKRSTDYRPLISITAEGLQLVEDLLPKWNELMNELNDSFGEEGMEALEKLETKIN